MRVLTVNVVKELIPGPKESGWTAIDKRPQAGRVPVGELGLRGDRQCDTANHGGPDQAVYAYAEEDALWWSEQLGREIPTGLFGENLRTAGVDLTGALIGEVWRIGDGDDAVELMVRAPRIPCITFQYRMGIARWVKRFHEAGRPGVYCKVLKPGAIGAGDPITVVSRPDHEVTAGVMFAAQDGPKMQTMLDSGVDLMNELRETARRVAGRTQVSPSAEGQDPGSSGR
ncbi:MOSC domain containing protein [Kribbella flavida DSM 17836]|uniref:MOSC domain containing protein n=1 Tax=Kribbella flavida (strain DSM 17836 / JCM 10339 / NBRC 14399) TaxID=479435 RepID=D2PUZ8_KRIFD|nr:MOSC domain-containing protein [Kribbella flavida]ADB31464.1 MOSC domain containing protein [Kribbella flavida DSM 17836]